MKTLFLIVSSMVVASILTVSTGWCHGVEGYVEQSNAHCITAMYDDGEPMSYAEPSKSKNPNQRLPFRPAAPIAMGASSSKQKRPVSGRPWSATVWAIVWRWSSPLKQTENNPKQSKKQPGQRHRVKWAVYLELSPGCQ